MTHTTLQKYAQQVTGCKDNHLKLTKFQLQKHMKTFFTCKLWTFSQFDSLAHRASFDRAKMFMIYILKRSFSQLVTPQ